jgi:hypothetical protein
MRRARSLRFRLCISRRRRWTESLSYLKLELEGGEVDLEKQF